MSWVARYSKSNAIAYVAGSLQAKYSDLPRRVAYELAEKYSSFGEVKPSSEEIYDPVAIEAAIPREDIDAARIPFPKDIEDE